MGNLKQWAKENSNWLKLDDGETFHGQYLGYSFAINQNGKEVPCYKFKDMQGNTKTLQSVSQVLINLFDEETGKFKKGDSIRITRRGLEKETKYEVETGDILM